MFNKESVNKARSLYYGFFSKLFIFTTDEKRYSGVLEALDVMIANPLDENSHEALKEIKEALMIQGESALIQEYDDLFHNPTYPIIRNTASYYHEGVESGHKQAEMKQFLAKTRLRRNEVSFKEHEDSVGFIFTFMHELVELIMQGQNEYDTVQHCVFAEIINPFIDEFIVRVYEHPQAKIYQSVAIVLNAFIAFDRLYFDVAKPPYKEVERHVKPVEVISGAEARRRAENKAKRDAERAQKAIS